MGHCPRRAGQRDIPCRDTQHGHSFCQLPQFPPHGLGPRSGSSRRVYGQFRGGASQHRCRPHCLPGHDPHRRCHRGRFLCNKPCHKRSLVQDKGEQGHPAPCGTSFRRWCAQPHQPPLCALRPCPQGRRACPCPLPSRWQGHAPGQRHGLRQGSRREACRLRRPGNCCHLRPLLRHGQGQALGARFRSLQSYGPRQGTQDPWRRKGIAGLL